MTSKILVFKRLSGVYYFSLSVNAIHLIICIALSGTKNIGIGNMESCCQKVSEYDQEIPQSQTALRLTQGP